MFLAESYIHRLNPFAIRFTETFGVRWYGLAYAAGFLLAWLFIRWMAKTRRSPMTVRDVGDLMLPAILGVLIGGRLGYCIFYEPDLLIDFSGSFPFWGLLAINRGGMSSHGGMIGVIVALGFFGRKRNIPILHLLDLGAITCTAGFFFGRIANFVNAELWGRPIPPALRDDPPWWSVKYPAEVTEHWLRLMEMGDKAPTDLVQRMAADFNITAPTQEALHAAVTSEAVQRIEMLRQQLGPVVGNDVDAYERMYQAVHNTSSHAHQPVMEALRPLLTPYYPSQLIQSLTDGLLVAILLAIIWLKPRKPGVIGAWWLVIYGVLRVATEAFRQPDEGVNLILGLSRGQQLSILMAAVGIVCLVIASRRNVARIGGLLKPTPLGEQTSS